jgi:hypothetical protein
MSTVRCLGCSFRFNTYLDACPKCADPRGPGGAASARGRDDDRTSPRDRRSRRGVALRVLLVAILVAVAGGLAACAVLMVASTQETSRQRQLAAELKPLLKGEPQPGMPTLREKVLVWNLIEDRLSGAQERLPPERQGRSSDVTMSVVLISSSRKVRDGTYDDGTPAYRLILTVGVVDLPERQPQGVYRVEGDAPRRIVLRTARGKRPPIMGNTEGPLPGWILGPGRLP